MMQLMKNTKEQQKRREFIKNEIEIRGLPFNKKSFLVKKFMNNRTLMSAGETAQRICELKYLYEYCNFDDIKIRLKESTKNNEDKKINLKHAEKLALNAYSNGTYPTKFPWELTNENQSPFVFLFFIFLYFLFLIGFSYYYQLKLNIKNHN